MYGPWWQLYFSYYTNLELTPDQSTAYPNFAVLQAYALAEGLDQVSDTAYQGST